MKKTYFLFVLVFITLFLIVPTEPAEAFQVSCGTRTYSGACNFARGAGEVIGNTCNGAMTVCIPTFVCSSYQEYNDITGLPVGPCTETCVQCGCSAACVAGGPCGDGDIDTGESCDDGNLTNGDGCSSSCSVEGGGGGGGGGPGPGVCSLPFVAAAYSSSNITVVRGNTGIFAVGLSNSEFTPNSINMDPAMTPSTSVTINKRNSAGFVTGNPITIPTGWSPTMINVEVVTNASTVAGTYTVNIPMVSLVDGDCTQSLTLTVNVTNPPPTPAPTVDLKVNGQDTSAGTPVIVSSGSSVNMTWAVLNATSCTATQSGGSPGAWAGGKNSNGGSQSLSPMSNTGSHNYTLTCSGPGGSRSDIVYAQVNPVLTTSSLTATPSSVAYNGASTIAWATSGYTSCSVSPSGWTGASGSQSSGALTTARTYTLSCLPADANSNRSVTVNVASAPTAVASISASPSNVAFNGASNITWSSSNATSCSVSPSGWTGTSGTQSSGALATSRTYTVSCLPAGANSSASVTVTVGAAPTATASLTTTPANVSYNGISIISWSSSNATSCTVTSPASSWSGTSGSQLSGLLTASRTYTMSCLPSGPNSTVSRTVTVGAAPTAVPTITATPSNVSFNSASTITWNSSNATSCTVSPGGWSSVAGSQTTGPLVANTTYTVSCLPAGPGSSVSTTVTVGAAPTAVPTITATPTSVPYNGASTITWNSSNATSCSVSPSGWTGTSGSQSTGGLTTSSTYTVSCLPAGPGSSVSTTVTVGSAPATASISAGATSLPYNGSTNITWSSSNATSCSVAPSGWTGTSGSQSTGALTTSRTYTASCLPVGPSSNASITITVAPAPVGLNVIKSGQGTVTGTTNPVQTNISCGPTCAATYNVGTIVTLTATPNTGRIFTGWGGTACSSFGRNPVCSFTISGATSVLVNFAVDPNFKEF